MCILHTSVDPLVLVAGLISPNLSSSGVPGKPRQRIQQKIEHYHKFSNIIWSFYCGFLPHKYYFISSSCPNWINKPWFGHDFLKLLFNFCTLCNCNRLFSIDDRKSRESMRKEYKEYFFIKSQCNNKRLCGLCSFY